ncbi:hypothetical protein [Piscinibacter sp. XHJ-5]|uniref:hypothetical protein n=1 Tax=Piscinibacter sp. XHJ-5 TaxID=3037797 RepID=UPI0024533B8A|nr:hypothetical protein [Piscinibacter sp. XHJ-5]
MFGRPKPVVFDRYASRRKGWRIPRWLVLLLTGVAAGAGGVLFVQERYLPPRLSAGDSATLRASYEQADSERLRLRGELAQTAKRLDAALAERKAMADELSASRQDVERLRSEAAFLVAALPPDPRGGAVQVRAARFTVEGRQLMYDVVLTRERGGGRPLSGVMQLVVAGGGTRESSVTPKPIAISVASHESVRGGVPLPDGFQPRETTIRVLDRVDGKLLGMRVMLVK